MKILIIDDEPKIRNGLSNLLTRREGWEVAGAYENAADALKYLAVNQVDVMITDIKMPEISGLELIARIRERDKKTAIIILSGYSNFQFAQRAIELRGQPLSDKTDKSEGTDMRSGRDGKKAGRKTRKRGRFRKDPKSVCTKGGRLHKAELFRKNFNQRNSGSALPLPELSERAV